MPSYHKFPSNALNAQRVLMRTYSRCEVKQFYTSLWCRNARSVRDWAECRIHGWVTNLFFIFGTIPLYIVRTKVAVIVVVSRLSPDHENTKTKRYNFTF